MIFIPNAHDGMCHGLPFRPILPICPNNIKSVGAIIEIGGGRNDPNIQGGRYQRGSAATGGRPEVQEAVGKVLQEPGISWDSP
jgi:hypothetical protein